ncbi:MAG: hypothetical protein UX91_C0001G0012 [Candidatus Amesbacteria bacterium GW2011_GWB1_47_19]|nr:MAG: hypothetical protein UW51_C0001G0012 [Candidatus Amesbacteria bacterium GW2011_GWA1_44_24]KKU32024.1 MAG: hypothetical protein UX46_C0001G0011 [Candidatus Amesbacteria bacterium GW2011_GWC1_46_24]KKU67708.1 MAG: hypothetical protein UX91_C0001G0012 [Candidatus Amesbacteria bacterium GW2011_GWB1_47_19]OGD06108.1 MAG: hypothetical protein A2379_03380 [Candidatus Amesbacteria bacterium RIFOXYB1_FULL_47_13]HBC72298.1 hypothetical protein [Candidatus Amesbacteria bacterium]
MATLTISLPQSIASQVDEEVSKQGYATRSEFFRALLRKYFASGTKFEVFSPQPLDNIKAGLKKTGKYNRKFINSLIQGLSESSVYAE